MVDYDILILGAGPGGYVAAIRAAQLGMKVGLIEKEHLGGTCLNWGCIPTKSLLHSAELFYQAKNSAAFGIQCADLKFDLSKIVEHSRSMVAKLNGGIAKLLKQNNIEVIRGHGRLLGQNRVSINNADQLQAKHIIIATGAKARVLPNLKPDGDHIWTYREAMLPNLLPKSLLVVGSGAIGIEFASFYSMLGSKVTILELHNRILRTEDEEIAAIAHQLFTRRGIDIITSASVKEHKVTPEGVQLILQTPQGEQQLVVERIISAVGVVPNLQDIGLENTKAILKQDFLEVDGYLQTAEKGLYAIGDVTSPPWLGHKASHEGIICVEKIAGLNPHPIIPTNIPGCIYCYPQIASIGLTQEQAQAAGIKVRIGKFPFAASGKAAVIGHQQGLVKTIFDATSGELLGAHLIGPEVSEMIHSFALGKQLEATEEDFIRTIFPHPTLSEAIHESVLAAYDQGLHLFQSTQGK